MKTFAIIMARGCSKGLPRKNVKLLDGNSVKVTMLIGANETDASA